MTSPRLDSVAPDLSLLLIQADESQRVRVLLATVDWILQRVVVDDERLVAGLVALRAGNFGDSLARSQLWELVEQLENEAWDADQDDEPRSAEYLVGFARARAVNCLWYGLAGSSAETVAECAYEAQAAFGDLAGLRAVVGDAIARGD